MKADIMLLAAGAIFLFVIWLLSPAEAIVAPLPPEPEPIYEILSEAVLLRITYPQYEPQCVVYMRRYPATIATAYNTACPEGI
jgi:hypothetical protein